MIAKILGPSQLEYVKYL